MKRKLAWLLAAIAVGAGAGSIVNELVPTKSHDVACPIFQVPKLVGGGGGGGDDDCGDGGYSLIGGFGG